jgi:hypothetical protein
MDLLFLLLDDIQQLALVRNVLRLLSGIRIASVRSVRLETLDLPTLLHVVLELTGFGLQLLVFGDLFLDLLPELCLH